MQETRLAIGAGPRSGLGSEKLHSPCGGSIPREGTLGERRLAGSDGKGRVGGARERASTRLSRDLWD